MKDVFAFVGHACAQCGVEPVVLMPMYKGAQVVCPSCGKATGRWWRLSDAWLEWEQITNKEVTHGR